MLRILQTFEVCGKLIAVAKQIDKSHLFQEISKADVFYVTYIGNTVSPYSCRNAFYGSVGNSFVHAAVTSYKKQNHHFLILTVLVNSAEDCCKSNIKL